MKLLRLNELPDNREGHILSGVIPGKYINKGIMSYKAPGQVTHGDEEVHVHDDAEVFIIVQGKAKMDMGEQGVIDMVTGDVLVVEPGENHHLIVDDDDPCINIWCHAGAERHPAQVPEE